MDGEGLVLDGVNEGVSIKLAVVRAEVVSGVLRETCLSDGCRLGESAEA